MRQVANRYALSRSNYYEMKQQGRKPAEWRVGRKALIAAASAREWQRRILADQKAKAVQKIKR